MQGPQAQPLPTLVICCKTSEHATTTTSLGFNSILLSQGPWAQPLPTLSEEASVNAANNVASRPREQLPVSIKLYFCRGLGRSRCRHLQRRCS